MWLRPPETVRSGAYPLARYLHLLTPRPPSGVVRRFVDWALGPGGQAIVKEAGYVPLWQGEPESEPSTPPSYPSVPGIYPAFPTADPF